MLTTLVFSSSWDASVCDVKKKKIKMFLFCLICVLVQVSVCGMVRHGDIHTYATLVLKKM